MLSFLYLALGRIFELLVLLRRSREAEELEILVLRHELACCDARGDVPATGRAIGRCSGRTLGRSL